MGSAPVRVLGGEESNLQPSAPKAAVLPIELPPKIPPAYALRKRLLSRQISGVADFEDLVEGPVAPGWTREVGDRAVAKMHDALRTAGQPHVVGDEHDRP